MVLTGLIIIAVAFIALMVPGCRVPGGSWRCQCQPQARTGQRPDPGHDIVSTFTSRDAEATGNPDQALAALGDHLATLSG